MRGVPWRLRRCAVARRRGIGAANSEGKARANQRLSAVFPAAKVTHQRTTSMSKKFVVALSPPCSSRSPTLPLRRRRVLPGCASHSCSFRKSLLFPRSRWALRSLALPPRPPSPRLHHRPAAGTLPFTRPPRRPWPEISAGPAPPFPERPGSAYEGRHPPR
jgi:hypothetical protein